ncbi:MAG: hypothetical protein VX768_12955 [Planctomycetota bacterium]|nr:hypothetical protein [Planctomycetota bacterium]
MKRKSRKRSDESSHASVAGSGPGSDESGVETAIGSRRRRFFALNGASFLLILLILAGVGGGLLLIDYLKRAPVREAREKIEAGDYGFALTVLNEYLISNPNDNSAKSLKGRAHAGLNEFQKCKEIYEQIEGVSDVHDMFAFAKSLTVLEQYAEGYSNWIGVMAKIGEGELDQLKAEKKNLLMAEALYFMAVCQTELGKLERAAQTAEDLKKVEGHAAVGHYLLGLIEIKRGREKVALQEWDQVLVLDPNSEKIRIPPYLFYYEVGILKVEQGESEQGIEMLEKSLTLNTFIDLQRASNAMEAIGSAFEELGNQEKSGFYWSRQIAFEKQYQLKPSLVAREGLANAALLKKEPVMAINFLVPLRNAGDVKSSTTYLMQRALAMQGKEKEARQFQQLTKELREKERKINTIREALREKPDTHWAVVIKAYDFAKDKNWSQAEQLLMTVKEHLNDDFSQRFLKAVANQGVLPPLTDVPVDIF